MENLRKGVVKFKKRKMDRHAVNGMLLGVSYFLFAVIIYLLGCLLGRTAG